MSPRRAPTCPADGQRHGQTLPQNLPVMPAAGSAPKLIRNLVMIKNKLKPEHKDGYQIPVAPQDSHGITPGHLKPF